VKFGFSKVVAVDVEVDVDDPVVELDVPNAGTAKPLPVADG
jgi:hypothetical protein